MLAGGLLFVAIMAGTAIFGLQPTLASTIILACFTLNFGFLMHCVNASGERMLSLACGLYFCFFLSLPALFQYFNGHFPVYRIIYDEDKIVGAALMALLFSAIFIATYSAKRRSRTPLAKHISLPSISPRFTSAGLVILLIAVVMVGFLSNPSYFLAKRNDAIFSAIQLSPSGYLIDALTRSGAFAAFVVAITAYLQERTVRPLWLLLMPIAFAAFVLVNFPTNVPRFELFGYGIALLVLTVDTRSTSVKWMFVAGTLLGQVTIFPFLSWLARGDRGTVPIMNPIDYYINHGDLDGFQSLINVYQWIGDQGLMLGREFASTLLIFVPRALWAGKSIGASAEAARFSGYSFLNVSMPLPGEFYADFGWVGVVAGAFLLAVCVARLEMAAERSQLLGRRLALAPYAAMVGFCTIVLRGPLIGVIGRVAFAVILLAIVARICRPPMSNDLPAETLSWRAS